MLRSLMQGFGRGVSWMDSSQDINDGFKLRFGSKSCADIAHKKFGCAEELAEFVNNGGCREVIDAVEKPGGDSRSRFVVNRRNHTVPVYHTLAASPRGTPGKAVPPLAGPSRCPGRSAFDKRPSASRNVIY